MPTKKIAISLDERVLERLDALVEAGRFANRSRAVEHAVRQTVERADRSRLMVEVAKLDQVEEQDLAEEWMVAEDHTWPEY